MNKTDIESRKSHSDKVYTLSTAAQEISPREFAWAGFIISINNKERPYLSGLHLDGIIEQLKSRGCIQIV